MLKYLLLSLCLLAAWNASVAQSAFIPKNLSAINSPHDEVYPLVTGDLTGLFFSRVNHPDNHTTRKNSASIWYAYKNFDGWFRPMRLDVLNIGKHNAALAITSTGDQLLVYHDGNLAIAARKDTSWNAPVSIDTKSTIHATLSSDGRHLIYLNGGKVYLKENINGVWGAPREIQQLSRMKISMPHLSENNRALYFVAKRKGNATDVFRAERTGDQWDQWSTPVPLTDAVNTPSKELCFRATPNAAWAYYSSTRNPAGKADLYEVKLYEDRPYVEVSGKIINTVTKRPLRKKDSIILVNGKPAEAVVYDKENAAYSIKLPFGNKYALTASVDHYVACAYEVDTSSDKEYRAVSLNIEQAPLPYVLLKGSLLVRDTGQPIPASGRPRILIDGHEVDSAWIDAATGRYEVEVNHGTSHYIQVAANRFFSMPELIDLTMYDGFEEVTVDLLATPERMAIIKGHIINQKTGKRIRRLSSLKLLVDGMPSVIMTIDDVSDQYELHIPLREKHVVAAHIPGFCSVYETIDLTREGQEIQVNRNLTLVPFETGQSVRLNVSFETGKTLVTPESQQELHRLVNWLIANPAVRIEIGAHTDESVKISTLDMAREVTSYLTNNGIAKNRVVARGYGSSKPVASNNTPEGRARNNRIEFTILEK